MRVSWLLPILLIPGLAPNLSAGICVSQSLANYIALGATGCQIGSLQADNFSFTTISSTVTILAGDITVTPVVAGNMLELMFTSSKFNVSGTDSANYLLAYTIDPGDIRGMEDIMNANSPVFPGLASVTTLACKDAAFTGAVCPTSTASLMTSDDGVTANLFDSTTFTPSIGTVGIRNTLELDANGMSSEIGGFSNVLITPEPATFVSGFLAFVSLYTRRRKLVSFAVHCGKCSFQSAPRFHHRLVDFGRWQQRQRFLLCYDCLFAISGPFQRPGQQIEGFAVFLVSERHTFFRERNRIPSGHQVSKRSADGNCQIVCQKVERWGFLVSSGTHPR
jgi:hypothetical protein